MGIPRRIAQAFLVITVAALAALPAEAAPDREIRKSFAVQSGGTLTIDTDRGSIEVRTHDVPRVDVHVTLDSGARADVNDFEVDFRPSGADLFIEGDHHRKRGGWLGIFDGSSDLRVKWNIVVPRQYQLELKTAGGSIHVRDLNGDVNARTSGGNLQLGRVQGRVHARTSGGGIAIEETGGEVDVSTSGGGIRITRARGDVRARTSGGSIRVDEVFGSIDAVTSGGSITASLSSQPGSDCRLSTSGGSVTVYLDPSIAVNLDARSSGGGVRAELPVTVRGEMARTRLIGQVNGGGPDLVLRTSGGGIAIRAR